MQNIKTFYIYIFLDNRKPGIWNYKNIKFNYQPFYVGRGSGNRINQHFHNREICKNTIKSNTIRAIMDKINEKPIHYKIYENLSFKEANDIEIDIIKCFGRRDINTGILSNMTDGGDGLNNISITDETREKFRQNMLNRNLKGELNPASKKVSQYDLNNNLIKIWNCMTDIQNKHPNFKRSQISNCCNGRCKTAYGFIWKISGSAYKKRENIIKTTTNNKTVYQYDLNGNFMKSFASATIAAKLLKINNISLACLGKQKMVGGYQWSYVFLGAKTSKYKPRIRIYSRYKNITFNKRNKKWVARAWINKKRINIGSFNSEEEAYLIQQKYIIDTTIIQNHHHL